MKPYLPQSHKTNGPCVPDSEQLGADCCQEGFWGDVEGLEVRCFAAENLMDFEQRTNAEIIYLLYYVHLAT